MAAKQWRLEESIWGPRARNFDSNPHIVHSLMHIAMPLHLRLRPHAFQARRSDSRAFLDSEECERARFEVRCGPVKYMEAHSRIRGARNLCSV